MHNCIYAFLLLHLCIFALIHFALMHLLHLCILYLCNFASLHLKQQKKGSEVGSGGENY
jgi:hypothetical protein